MKTKDVSIFNVLLTFIHSMHYKIALYFATDLHHSLTKPSFSPTVTFIFPQILNIQVRYCMNIM